MRETTHCDWCLRPLAPDGVSWDDVDDPEGYCWGDEQQGCACDDAHEEAWPKMLSEVARLREQVAEGERKLGTARALLPIQDGRPVSQGALNALLSQRDTAWDQLDEERATSARLRGLLREVEHAAAVVTDRGVEPSCPICCRAYPGHAIDCRLAAALEVGHG
jgi:hypothetical protein